MLLLELPAEIRLHIWSTFIETSIPANDQIKQICAQVDQFCGQRYTAINVPPTHLLLANRQVYREVSAVLHTMTPKLSLKFCSPGCIADVIPRLSGLQLTMAESFEMDVHGTWGIPIEAVQGIRRTILDLLHEADDKQHHTREREEGKQSHPCWKMGFKQQRDGVLLSWMLEFRRTPSELRKELCDVQ